MDIKETTPPQQRTFKLDVTETELSEIRIAFNHMLQIEPQWYTNTQRANVQVMVSKINEMLGRIR